MLKRNKSWIWLYYHKGMPYATYYDGENRRKRKRKNKGRNAKWYTWKRDEVTPPDERGSPWLNEVEI